MNMCFKICIWTSTHSETHKKWINTEIILGFILKVSMETMKLKIVNVTNIKRHKYKIETETHTLKPLCHMGPLHPVLNIREAETAVRLQTSQTQGAKPKSKPAKHRAQNQSNQKPKLQQVESANRKSDYAHIEPKPRQHKRRHVFFMETCFFNKIFFVVVLDLVF